MVNVRSRARFAQKARSSAGVLRDVPIDDLKSDSRVQHCIASAVRYGHSSGTELDWKTIRAHFHLEVCVFQRSGR
jgi:hypothetical protein